LSLTIRSLGYLGASVTAAGSEETTVDPPASQNLIATLNTPNKTLWIIDGADHMGDALTPDQTHAEATIEITAYCSTLGCSQLAASRERRKAA
jgi:hypothetical protein